MADASLVERHRRGVVELSREGAALAPSAPTATIRNPEWFAIRRGELEPTYARTQLHESLKHEYLEKCPDVRNESRAMVLAGPPGAGKSTAKGEVLGERAEQYLTVDADEFKAMLLREALRDGSYDSFIKPEAVKSLESLGEQFFPLELASLVHEESSYLAKQLRDEALREGKNVIIDTVLSSETSARELGRQLTVEGYTVEVLDVEVPYEISQGRIVKRWQQSYEEATEKGGLGGRWVPSEYARGVFDGPNGKTKSEASARVLAEECPAVQRYRVYRTTQESTPERPAVASWEVDLQRASRGGPLVDPQAAAAAKHYQANTSPPPQIDPTRGHDFGR
ncbi:zeta toxin family protein [Pseudoclavibacter terrae]|uniref:zeta toxin family protein n=1 Tax=Pseudoclavibacter terrae TaxID=1530195 RepID=UPI0023304A82|nr:zeta toxin family protein [Pseudoclavibacter terrae]